MRRLLILLVFLVLVVVAPILASCSEGETVQRCTSIPAGGCPLSRGLACEDPTCEAVYLCRPNNVWELDRMCPPRPDAGRDVSIPDAADEPTVFDANIDAPPGAYGGVGCANLQAPDCPLGVALSCSAGCCGCEDLFVCENGGWTTWGVCDEASGIRPQR